MKYTAAFLLLLLPLVPAAQTAAAQLTARIRTADSLLFAGFNNCDLAVFERLVSERFEFYHDEAGITSTKSRFIESIRQGICKLPYRPLRRLHDSTLEVYPLYQDGQLYGAVETGVHSFYARYSGKEEEHTSTARFLNLWLLEEGQWRLSRSISYDHRKP